MIVRARAQFLKICARAHESEKRCALARAHHLTSARSERRLNERRSPKLCTQACNSEYRLHSFRSYFNSLMKPRLSHDHKIPTETRKNKNLPYNIQLGSHQ